MVKLIQEYFLLSAQKFPEKIAVSFLDQNITYQELDVWSTKLAHLLRSLGLQRNDRVAFNLHKSIRSVVSILGILKADAGYVPLDARSPVARLRQIVDDCKPAVIICDQQTLAETTQLIEQTTTTQYQPKIIVLDKAAISEPLAPDQKQHYYGEDDISRQPLNPMQSANSSNDLAYIFYTSGST